MLKAGITGGIGSGKSTVCRVFSTLGIPVFDADSVTRYLMENDAALVQALSSLLGSEVYKQGKLDRKLVAAMVFGNPELLQHLNSLTHPATTKFANEWHLQQSAPYTIKEAALFFEAGTNKDMDVMIGVSAPEELRIARAMARSGSSREEIKSRIRRQMDESKKMNLCDFVIINDDKTAILPQILSIHHILMDRSRPAEHPTP